MKEDRLIEDWLNKECSPSEKKKLEKVIAFTEKLETPSRRTQDDAWEDILSKIESTSSSNNRILATESGHKKNIKYWVAAAAVIILIAVYNFSNEGSSITLQAPIGERLSATLPDNSKVTLNAGTVITYREKNFVENRLVVLSGEAFFEVTKGRDFTVMDGYNSIQVLGTSFNVYNRSESLKVSVFTGKVKVFNDENSVTLIAGQEAELLNNEFKTNNFNTSQTATWRNGSFYFDTEPLSKIIEELERQFDIDIIVNSDISERYYSGYFNKENLTEALQLVFIPMGLIFSTEGKEVTIE